MHHKADVLAAIGQIKRGTVFMVPVTIEALRARQQEIDDGSKAILAAADAEERDLTPEEVASIGQNRTEMERIAAQIEARESVIQPQAGAGRRTAPEIIVANGAGRVAPQLRATDPRGGFRSFGEFASLVRAAAVSGQPEARLLNATTTWGGEGSGADGGFAVPPTFRTTIWEKVMAEENLLNRCAELTTGGNSITIPSDETTPWDTSNGIQVYWEAEAATVTASKPQLDLKTIRLGKLMGLVPITDELLEDAPGLESWLLAKAPAKMAAKINTAIIAGSGVGQPLGILNAGCTVSIAEESSQSAATILFANIEKMWAALYGPCRRNAVWLINQDVEPQLNAIAFDPKASSKVPAYLPANGLSVEPYATLMGRPVVPLEACQTIGTVGDIILADMNQYWALTKGQGGMKTDVSMHLYFDQGLQAFRFTFRVNGQPAWGKSITPQYGTMKRSCFVTLATRS
jgi:HK97 family phage major capsid protein